MDVLFPRRADGAGGNPDGGGGAARAPPTEPSTASLLLVTPTDAREALVLRLCGEVWRRLNAGGGGRRGLNGDGDARRPDGGADGGAEHDAAVVLWVKSSVQRDAVVRQVGPVPDSMEWSYVSEGGGAPERWVAAPESEAAEFDAALERVVVKYVADADTLRRLMANVHLFGGVRGLVLDDFDALCAATATPSAPQGAVPAYAHGTAASAVGAEILALAAEALRAANRPAFLAAVVAGPKAPDAAPPSTTRLRRHFRKRVDVRWAPSRGDNCYTAAVVDHVGLAPATGSAERVTFRVV